MIFDETSENNIFLRIILNDVVQIVYLFITVYGENTQI